MPDLYHSPEKFGLSPLGEIQWGPACYDFDLTVVWQDTTTGALYFADDSGCSCPSPFESQGRDDLTPIDKPQTFIDHVNKRIKDMEECGYRYEHDIEEAKGDSGELVLKVREALR
jgi:hypothetical protein